MAERMLEDGDLEILMARHRRRLMRFCHKLVRDDQQAEDLCQTALVTAWERRHTYEGRSTFSSWLIGIAHNLWRNENRRKRELLSEDLLEPSDPGLSVLKALTADERRTVLAECVHACLDPVEQSVAWMRYDEGASLAVIEERLDLPGRSGARGVLQRIRRKLKIELRARLAELGHGTSFVRTRC